jgi:hypothetical protein
LGYGHILTNAGNGKLRAGEPEDEEYSALTIGYCCNTEARAHILVEGKVNEKIVAFASGALVDAHVSDAELFANRSALFANDAESAMIACSLL